MTRHVPICLILCLLTFGSFGQITISVTPETFVKYGHPTETDIEYHIQVTNTSSASIDLYWSKRLNNAPGVWWSWVCDPNKCYLPEVTSCPEDLPNPVAPAQTIDISLHINPRNIEGSGLFEFNLLDGDGNILGEVDGDYIVSLTSSGSVVSGDSKLSVFPNPTSQYFQTSNITGLKKVEVYNMVGNKIKAFEAGLQKQYFVGDLPEGMYLVRLVDGSGKILKTIRLSIQ
jgi:hypothetical protein